MLQDSKPKTPHSADKWLKNTDKLHTLYLKQQKELVLTEIICRKTGLQTDTFYIAAIHAETLVLQTNNATIATQLRMASSEILSVISDDNQWKKRLTKLKVNVRPFYQKQRAKHKKLRRISPENSELLEEVAGYTEDPKLKEVLLRISRHRKT